MAKVLMKAKSYIWDGGPERIAPGTEFAVANDKEAERLEAAGVAERVKKPASPPPPLKSIERLKVDDLKALAKDKGVDVADDATKDDIVDALKAAGIDNVE